MIRNVFKIENIIFHNFIGQTVWVASQDAIDFSMKIRKKWKCGTTHLRILRVPIQMEVNFD